MASHLTAGAMKERTQACRTAEVTLTVAAKDGPALANVPVSVRQVRHKFLFGCDAFLLLSRFVPQWYAAKPHYSAAWGNPEEVLSGYEERLVGLMNFATVPFYWGSYERRRGRPVEEGLQAMARWLAGRGLRVKGHPLCWHDNAPRWLENLPDEEVVELQWSRIAREVARFAGLIDVWDVVNESWIMPDWPIRSTPVQRLARQAVEAEEMYGVLFSHPAVEAITYWDLSDPYTFQGAPVGLVRKDMSPNPACEALTRLVSQEWWAAERNLTTDARGQVRFRGFLGGHVARVAGQEVAFDLDAAGQTAQGIRV